MRNPATGDDRRWLSLPPLCAALRVTALLSLAGLVWWAASPALTEVRVCVVTRQSPPGGWTVDRLVVDGAACTLMAVAAWLAAVVVLNITGAVVTKRSSALDLLAQRITPRRVRRCVLGVCGLAMSAPGFATTAGADDATANGSSVRSSGSPPEVISLDGLPLPDLPSPAPLLLVRPGDSLWVIAERELRPGATDRAVVASVAALYAANRLTIGDNPNLIFPGQRLTAPGGPS